MIKVELDCKRPSIYTRSPIDTKMLKLSGEERIIRWCRLLQVINQGAKSLRCADQVLVKELQPLDTWTVGHESVKLVGVGGVDLR